MQNLRIESNIPIPAIKLNKPKRFRYPFDQLQVGQSFRIPGAVTSSNISNSMKQAKNRTGFLFVVRAAKKGVRVWRVK